MLMYPSMVFDRLQSRQTAMFPLGLGYIAGVLENEFEVTMLDSALEGYENLQHLPNGKTVYGLDERAMKSAIERFAPDAVLVSCLFSSLHDQALRVTRLAKEADAGIVTLVGGPHVSAIPRLLLREPSIDYCIIGEGEYTALRLLRSLREGKKLNHERDGLGFRTGGSRASFPKSSISAIWMSCPSRHGISLTLTDIFPLAEFRVCVSTERAMRLPGLYR